MPLAPPPESPAIIMDSRFQARAQNLNLAQRRRIFILLELHRSGDLIDNGGSITAAELAGGSGAESFA